METIRDSAFGKLVRIFSRKRWLRYPEENDTGMWTEYLKTEKQVKDEEAAASESDQENLGLYTVLSQASRASRRLSSASTVRQGGGEGAHPNPNASLVIDWSGPDDPEVRIDLVHCLRLHLIV